jgi:aspartyl-tRNA(Asn)/glutamyl-tRNA(Gln) amidotransferase subunit C
MSGEVLGEQQVRHVAALARLALDDAEIADLTPKLAAILRYAEQVGEVAADDVEPMTHPLGLVDVLRDDVPGVMLSAAEVLAAAPDPQVGRFGVPRIVEEDA